jgi:hypothetical protein
MSPLDVSFFHNTHTAVVEFKGAGLGSITRLNGFRFVPFSASTRRGIPTGPFVSIAGAIRSVFQSFTEDADDKPSYVALAAIEGTWSARSIALRPMFVRGIPTIRVRRDPVRDPIGRILGMTRLGAVIIEELPIDLDDGQARRSLQSALTAEVARLTNR